MEISIGNKYRNNDKVNKFEHTIIEKYKNTNLWCFSAKDNIWPLSNPLARHFLLL